MLLEDAHFLTDNFDNVSFELSLLYWSSDTIGSSMNKHQGHITWR